MCQHLHSTRIAVSLSHTFDKTEDIMKDKFEELVNIIKKLRAPDGCPWDKEQTLYSMREHLIEEAYELVDALDNQNIDNIKEELGDILLHVIFHANIAEEDGLFTLSDVIDTISDKMVRRHPHVFGTTAVNGTDEVLENWETIKQQEKQERQSIFDSISGGLPSIYRAMEYQKKARKVGFDWDCADDCMEKVHEEFGEFQEAIQSGDTAAIEHELGDAMFALINMSRFLKVDPDQALRMANKRFYDRFKYIEDKLAEQGKKPEDSNLEEMDALWDAAKEAFKTKAP